jgi:hypothetical protein
VSTISSSLEIGSFCIIFGLSVSFDFELRVRFDFGLRVSFDFGLKVRFDFGLRVSFDFNSIDSLSKSIKRTALEVWDSESEQRIKNGKRERVRKFSFENQNKHFSHRFEKNMLSQTVFYSTVLTKCITSKQQLTIFTLRQFSLALGKHSKLCSFDHKRSILRLWAVLFPKVMDFARGKYLPIRVTRMSRNFSDELELPIWAVPKDFRSIWALPIWDVSRSFRPMRDVGIFQFSTNFENCRIFLRWQVHHISPSSTDFPHPTDFPLRKSIDIDRSLSEEICHWLNNFQLRSSTIGLDSNFPLTKMIHPQNPKAKRFRQCSAVVLCTWLCFCLCVRVTWHVCMICLCVRLRVTCVCMTVMTLCFCLCVCVCVRDYVYQYVKMYWHVIRRDAWVLCAYVFVCVLKWLRDVWVCALYLFMSARVHDCAVHRLALCLSFLTEWMESFERKAEIDKSQSEAEG